MTREATTPTATGAASRLRDLASRLYQGDAGIDVVGKRKIWYSVAAAILLIGIATIFVRPFNFGIEFRGGHSFTIPASVGTLEEVRGAVEDTGAEVASAQRIGGGSVERLEAKPVGFDGEPAERGCVVNLDIPPEEPPPVIKVGIVMELGRTLGDLIRVGHPVKAQGRDLHPGSTMEHFRGSFINLF